MKKLSLVLAVVLTFSFVVGQAFAADTIKWRCANVTQVNHPMNKGCEFFIERLKKASNGRFEVKNYPARQLGDDRELFEQVQQGSLEMALISVAPVGSTSDLAAAFQLPFMFENWEQWLKVMFSKQAQDVFDGFEKNNVRALACYDSGFRNALTVSKVIHSPEDFKGLKFRVAETPMHIAIFTALGASPTPIPYGEIYSSLQNKVIDGLEMDFPAILMEKHYEVAKNVTLTKHFTWPGVFMINLDKWKSLSPEDQKMVTECAREAMKDNVAYIQGIESKAMAELRAKGVNVVELTPAERQKMVEATRSVVETYRAKDPRIGAFADFALSAK